VPRAPRLTEKDRTLLEFLAEHRIVRARHVQQLLGVSLRTAQRRLARLGAAGYLEIGQLYTRQPNHYLIKRRGLTAVDSRLSPPRLDQMKYRHDIGMAWIWLAAKTGAFGELTEMHSERQMRSDDARAAADPLDNGDRFGSRMLGWGPNDGEQIHYPDLVLHTATGHRVAVELELTGKSRARLERIIGRYAADPHVDAVLYLVDDGRRANEVITAARRLGASKMIHVQRARWSERVGPPTAATSRTPARARPAPTQRTSRRGGAELGQ
jgi:hypothetical protein